MRALTIAILGFIAWLLLGSDAVAPVALREHTRQERPRMERVMNPHCGIRLDTALALCTDNDVSET